METRRLAARAACVAALGLALVACSGCAAGLEYGKYRVQDALDVVDVGLTVTAKPCIGLYWNSLDVFPVGYSYIDGYFVGWGGGQIGVTRHFNECWGLGIGHEEIGWGKEFDKDDPDTMYTRYSGILGTVVAPHKTNPGYTPSCVHFFPHVGFIGLVWNARYMEMADFVLGWTTLDIAGDDGFAVGKWAFPYRKEEG